MTGIQLSSPQTKIPPREAVAGLELLTGFTGSVYASPVSLTAQMRWIAAGRGTFTIKSS